MDNIIKNFNLPEELITAPEKMNLTEATKIQKQSIPVAMAGSDVLASSQTGSAKTLAYLLPIINCFIQNKTTALVLVPTRELATQICSALTKVTVSLKISSAVLIGDKVIIGTPGRIVDHLNRGSLKIDQVGITVLDEMDRMLDMGMKEQLEEINKFLPEKKKTSFNVFCYYSIFG